MALILDPTTIQKINKSSKDADVDFYKELGKAEAVTHKGAKSYSIGSHDPRVVLLTKTVRGMELRDPSLENDTEKYLEFLLEESWKVSPLDTLRLIFYIRDCRGGKGEKLIFRAACRWLLENHRKDLEANLKHIPFYGTWKDPLQTFGGTSIESSVIKLHCSKLSEDINKLGTLEENTIDTGAAKFAPSEGCSFDKEWKMVSKFAGTLGVNKSQYRKQYLRPLRSARVPIVEEIMCAKNWDEINFSVVPSVAGKIYKKAFQKHCSERYSKFLERVSKGEEKINVGVLTPPEIIEPYTYNTCMAELKRDATVEAQWSQMLKDRRQRRLDIVKEVGVIPVNALCVIDVSGSMFSGPNKIKPIDVSVSLGILISHLNDFDSPFYRKWITFSETPKMETFKGEELFDITRNMDRKNWGMSTNFQSVFNLILETASAFSAPQDKMPGMLIVISDMQFDSANPTNTKTNWEMIENKYKCKGYKRPTLVFWNVNSASLDMPVPHSEVPDCALVGGFSANILDPLIDGVVPSPMAILRKIVDSPRYERICLADGKEE